MSNDAALAQLDAIRAQLDALAALLGGSAAPEPGGPCQHPEDARVPQPVMGKPRQFRCVRCMQVVNPGTEAPDGAEGDG